MSDFADFWRYLFLTLYAEAVAIAAVFTTLAMRCEDIRNVLCLLHATL
jgi:hypothetical protein